MRMRSMPWMAVVLLLTATGLAVSAEPLTLDQCTAIALSRNPQISASQQQLIAAQAALARSRSSYSPQLSLSAVEGITGRNGGLSQDTARATSDSDTREELDLALQMTFWQQGRKESVEQTKASLRASEFDDAATVQALVEQVAGDYYGVLAAQQLLEVAQGGVESARGHLEQVKARVAWGAAADVDVLLAEDDLAKAQLDLIDVRSSVELALAQLRNAMAVPPGTPLELAESPPSAGPDIPSLEEALQTALEARPDVSASRAAAQASGYGLAQAKIARGPVAEVGGTYNEGLTDWSESDSSWDLLLSVSWPLFDGGAAKADETTARASLKRSQAELQRVINQVGLEVENALVEVQRTRERVAASETSVAAAEARLAAAEGKYQQDRGILLEVIDARVAVTTARANQVQARYDQQIALVGLQKALGTLAVPEMGGGLR